MSEQINAVIDNLADKLGIAVSEVYRVMANQARAEIAMSLFGSIVCIVVILLCLLYVKKFFIDKNQDGEPIIEEVACSSDEVGILIVVIAVALIVVAIVMAFCFVDSVQNIIQCAINPEYWALNQIFKMIK